MMRPGRMLPRLWNTTGVRLAALGAGLAALSAAIVFVVIYVGVLGAMRATLDADVNSEISEILMNGPATSVPVAAAQVRAAIAESPDGVFYRLDDVAGRRVAGNFDAPMPPPGWHRMAAPAHHPFAPHVRVLRGRVVALGGGRLLVATDATMFDRLDELIRRSFLVGFGITLVLGLAVGIASGRRAVARVEAAGAAGREIMDGDLSRRLPLSGAGDEFDHLAANINAMLARIEQLMAEIRAVTHEIAHDLRSPLARLRETLELAVRAPETMPAAIGDAIVQADAALALSAAILRLAQIESGARRASFSLVDLSRLLGELGETFEIVIEDQGGRLLTEIEPGLEITGDAALLTQMLVNLIENAMTHGGPGTTVVLRAARRGRDVEISIADDGPGIPPDRRAEALRRFGRLDPSRTSGGHGLGLPLAAAIARLHDATLELAQARDDVVRPGLRVTVRFQG